jgi:hypothetical protein
LEKTVADKFATSASYTVSGATVVGGALSLSDIALVIGIIGTIATLVLTWYFKKRSDHREQIRHEIELKKLDAEIKRIAQEASK